MKNIIKLFCVVSFFITNVVYADIKFWTTEVQPARMAKQEEMAKAFEAKTGIKVEVIPIEEKDLGTSATAAAAAVVAHLLDAEQLEDGVVRQARVDRVRVRLLDAAAAQHLLELHVLAHREAVACGEDADGLRRHVRHGRPHGLRLHGRHIRVVLLLLCGHEVLAVPAGHGLRHHDGLLNARHPIGFPLVTQRFVPNTQLQSPFKRQFGYWLEL